jgi:hypothetical protein
MKKLMLSFVVCLMAMTVAYAQTADKKKDGKKDGKYETVEITMDKVPDAVKASLKAEGITDADVKKVWKVKKRRWQNLQIQGHERRASEHLRA